MRKINIVLSIHSFRNKAAISLFRQKSLTHYFIFKLKSFFLFFFNNNLYFIDIDLKKYLKEMADMIYKKFKETQK